MVMSIALIIAVKALFWHIIWDIKLELSVANDYKEVHQYSYRRLIASAALDLTSALPSFSSMIKAERQNDSGIDTCMSSQKWQW